MQRKLLKIDEWSLDRPSHRESGPSAARINAPITAQCPPELTGDPHTDWVLWELSLTLSEITRNVRTRQDRQSPSGEEATSDCE